MMGKGIQNANIGSDVNQVVDQLERHCLASDGSLLSKSAFLDLQLAREDMCRERLRFLEAMAIYSEAIGMVEDYQHPHLLPLSHSRQVNETLEHRLVVAEAAQKLRLPLISNDGEIHHQDIDNFNPISRSSLDSTTTISSTSNSTNYTTTSSATDMNDPGIGGVPDRYLGITSAYLWQTQQHQAMDMADYQMSLFREIEARLRVKCDKLAHAFVMDDLDDSAGYQNQSSRLPERVKIIIEEIEREEEALKEDLYSADRKFAEYYNVLEQILAVFIKLVKDLKLQNQHKYDELQKTWQIKRHEAMGAKLRALEHIFLVDTYTTETIPALHEIRKYLVKATEEASINYKKAVTRLREYQGVDPHFDKIARQYHDIDKKLQNMQWTIEQVQMDLKSYPDHSNT